MASRNELFNSQQEVAEYIRKMIINMKKDPPTRRTLKYIETRRTTLQQYWEEFEANHSVLNQEVDDEHLYFKNDYHKQTLELYEVDLKLLHNFERNLTAAEENPGGSATEQINNAESKSID